MTEDDEFIELEAVYIFKPGDAEMQQQYPELKAEKAFKTLTNSQLMFVWYYANKTSPFRDLPDHKKINQAWMSSGFDAGNKNHLKLKHMNKWPDHIEKAMEKMAEYNPDLRFQANIATANIFNNMKLLIATNESELKLKEPNHQKQYMDMVIGISKEMPNIIKKLEEGYGITTGKVKVKNQEKETRLADEVPVNKNHDL